MRPIDLSTGNVMIHLLTETMSTSYTHLNMCLSHFSSQQIGLGLERRTYYVAQNFFFGGGGVLGVWEFFRLSLVLPKKKKTKKKIYTFCLSKNSYQSSIFTPYRGTLLSYVVKG